MSPLVPVRSPTHQVRLHLKVLHPPRADMPPEAMAAYMRDVYAPYGIEVVVASPVEHLGNLEQLKDLRTDGCMLGEPTADQRTLFAHRDGAATNDLCIYFIRSTVDDEAAGCASLEPWPGFPDGRPAAVVTEDATPWTLGHECGHLLGLSHVLPVTQVMVSGTWQIKVDPPVLEATEVEKIKESPFAQPVVLPAPPTPPLPDPSPAKPPAAESAADAIQRKTQDGDDEGLADTIRRELDRDDGLDYERLARRLGPGAVEALSAVVCASRPRIAAGAVSLAARLEGATGFPVVAQGSANAHPVVRVAAASSARRLPAEPTTPIVLRLLEDRDVGVRGHAIRSAVRIGAPVLVEQVRAIAERDPSLALRELAAELLDPPRASAS
jgi:HEAT repeats